MKRLVVALAAVLAASCGGNTPTPPTSPPPVVVPPPTFTLSGRVTSTATGAGISGATVRVIDGPNANRTTTTNSAGEYSLTGLLSSGMTVNASAPNYVPLSLGVTFTESQVMPFFLTPTQ
jgi:carboxypeptidase family protein